MGARTTVEERPRAARAVGALAVLLVAAGCGTAERPPDEVAREFVTSTEPSKCGLLTRELLERQTGRRGEAALRFCERNVVRLPPPSEVRLVESEVRGRRAQVELVVDQREERLELVRGEDGWRIYATGR